MSDEKLSNRPKRGKRLMPEPGTNPVVLGSKGDRVDGAWFKEFTLETPMERIEEGPHKAKLKMLVDQVAALTSHGMDRKQIAGHLGIDDESVDKILHRQDCMDAVRKIGESARAFAKTKIRREISKLADEAIKVVTYHLKEKQSLHAVTIALKVLGFDEMEDKGDKATSLTVVMPGAAPGQNEKVKLTSKS